jgi:secretion/DNA translocation related TadE-like protein
VTRRVDRTGPRDDEGAGSVLALALVATTVALALSMTALGAGLAARQRLIGAADAAAIAAADVLLGAAAGEPCVVAEEVAAANGGLVGGCEIDGYVVTVSVRATFAGVPLSARSTAGPAPAR